MEKRTQWHSSYMPTLESQLHPLTEFSFPQPANLIGRITWSASNSAFAAPCASVLYFIVSTHWLLINNAAELWRLLKICDETTDETSSGWYCLHSKDAKTLTSSPFLLLIHLKDPSPWVSQFCTSDPQRHSWRLFQTCFSRIVLHSTAQKRKRDILQLDTTLPCPQ